MERTEAPSPLLLCIQESETGSISDRCQDACMNTPQIHRLLHRWALPFLHTIPGSLQLPTWSLFSSLKLHSVRPTRFLNSHCTSTRSPLFQVRYHQLLTLHQHARLQLTLPVIQQICLGSGRERGQGTGDGGDRADSYILNRLPQAQEQSHAWQL